MKIGILTFHRANSYGAVLQAYALQSYLVSIGYDAEIVDYRNEYFEVLYHSFKINLKKYKQFENAFGFKQILKRLIEVFYTHMVSRKFFEFQDKYLKMNPYSDGYNELKLNKLLNYDYFIVGSDQVWNYRLTDGDEVYFLPFCDENKRVSFAASIGGYPIEKENNCIYLLNHFKKISVREIQTKEKLLECGVEKNIFVHLDPVFLVRQNSWNKIISKQCEKNYILVFEVGREVEVLNQAVKYAEEYNKKLYYLSTDYVRPLNKKVHNLHFAGPNEFLAWIKYADYIFTNSFHATAFSIIFKKNFYCHLKSGQKSNDRLINLLEKFNMVECSDINKIGTNFDKSNIEKAIDNNFEEVKKYFEETFI